MAATWPPRYETKGDCAAAIAALATYMELRPKDADGLTPLATDYEQQSRRRRRSAGHPDRGAERAADNVRPAARPRRSAARSGARASSRSARRRATRRTRAFNTALSALPADSRTSCDDAYSNWRIVQAGPRRGASSSSPRPPSTPATRRGRSPPTSKFIKLAPDDPTVPLVKAADQGAAGVQVAPVTADRLSAADRLARGDT